MIFLNDKFHAIVTDPPFGRREKAMGSCAESPLGDSKLTISSLLAIAGYRLRLLGRLVCWLPTEASVAESDVIRSLDEMQIEGGDMALKMKLLRLRVQPLNSGLWRWLCVFQKIK